MNSTVRIRRGMRSPGYPKNPGTSLANLQRYNCRGLRALIRPGMLIAAVLPSALSGCGYVIGSAYQPEIRTIHVPTITSSTFRRGVEFQLTEAVQKEIQNRSHFRLVKGPYADTRLTGNIAAVRKWVLGESGFDDPRELQLSMAVEVTWEDLRTGEILAQRQIPLQAEAVQLMSTASFAPEVGQSLATGTQQVIDRLARQIVEMMEMPW